ncbi:hypothetical protein E0J20_09320 [Rhizobium leguminosarum bv. viciae]|nr:hypothetical protein E0J20_09320 [Rhizobium leguminosarum bv. viciae]
MKTGRRIIASAVLSGILSSCGLIIPCPKECPPGWVHADPFCGCMQKIPDGKVSRPGVSAAQADCLCAVDGSNKTAAWFRNKPSAFPQSAFNVYSSSCLASITCAQPITGTYSLKNAQWTQTTFANGYTFWFAAGDLEQASELKQKMTPIPWSSAIHMMKVAAGPLPDNLLPTCIAACETGDLNCFRLEGSQQIAGLNALHEVILKKPEKIAPSDLMSMFSTTDDPCHRGDTNFSNGQVSNVGDSCTLTASLPIGQNVELEMPELLHGSISMEGPQVRSEFNDPRTRAKLRFTAQDQQDAISVGDAATLSRDWGGDIKAVASDGKKTVFSVGDKSCISVTLP